MTASIVRWPKRLPEPPQGRGPERAGLQTALAHLRAQLLDDRDRWVLWLPVGLGVGAAVYFGLPTEPPVIVLLSLALLHLGACLAMPAGWRRPVFVACLVVWAGAFAGKARTQLVAAPRLTQAIGPVSVEGTVEWAEKRAGGRWRLVLSALTVEGLKADETPRRLRLSLPDSQAAPGIDRIGGRISLRARLSPPNGPVVPGGYDFARTAYFDGVGAVALVAFSAEPVAAPPERGGFAASVAQLRRTIGARIEAHLPPRLAGLATALITGARGGVGEADLAALRDAGLAHMLAISGLHIGLVAGLVFFVLRGGLVLVEPLALRLPVKQLAALGALMAAAVYLFVSGASVSTQRAFIMLSVALLAVMLGRPALTLRSVALAAGLILLWRPESLLSPGFQMSFGAVTCLVAGFEWMRDRARKRDDGDRPGPAARVGRYVLGLALTTLIAEMATAPFAAFHFNRAVTYGLLGNEVAMPILGFAVMPLAVVSVAAMPFGWEGGPLTALGWAVDGLLAAAHWTAGLPGAVMQVESWGLASLVLAVFGGLWLCLWTKPLRFAGLAPIALALVLNLFRSGPDLVVGPKPNQLAARIRVGGEERLLLLGTRASGFRGEVWAAKMGHGPRTVVTGRSYIPCDDRGCVFNTMDGARVAIVDDGRALPEDCRFGGVLISRVAVAGDCPGPAVIIDPTRLDGEMIVSLKSDGKGDWRLRGGETGRRPWSAKGEARP